MRGGWRSGGRGSGGGSSGGGQNGGGYRNPCLTMHQPWASLLVAGIKRVEGRSWPSPVTGRLWIHAAGKVPDPDTVAAMEAFYREIHAVDGVSRIDFPRHYPVSRLLGCVEVVGCVRSEELVCWEDVPESVRLEGLTDFCWLCENPQKLVVPFEMRGYQGVYNLERRIYEGAVRGLSPVQGPLPVKFPLPDPRNPFSLKPGSLSVDSSKPAPVKTPSVSAAIAGARAAANQYTRKDSNAAASTRSEIQTRNKSREDSADSNSGSGSLPSIVQDSPSPSQRLNRSPVVQNTPSYSRNQNPASVIVNSPPHLQIQNHSAAANQYTRKDSNAAASTSSEIQTRNKSREDSADSNSGSGSLPSVVQDSPSPSQRLNRSPVVQNTPSYLRNQNPASVIVNSPPHLQIQNHSAAASSSEVQTRNKSREDRPDSSAGSGSLASSVQDSPFYSQRQNPLSTVQNIPSYSQNQNPVSIVGSIPIYSQNPPFIVHAIPSYPHNQIPVSIVGSIPIYLQDHSPSLAAQNSPSVLQNRNPEPRRSPRLQIGASNRLVAVALRDLKQSSSSEGRVRCVPKSRPE